jgi:hypothetical protein
VCVTDLFLKNFLKMIIPFEIYAGWIRIPHAAISDNW